MKHIFILAMTLMVSIATSCTKDLEAPTPTQSNDPYVIISLEDSEMETRSFFDDNLAGESWERELNNVTVFLVRQDDNDDLITKRLDLSQDEISDMKSKKVTMEGAVEGEDILVYALANIIIPTNITEFEDLLAYCNDYEIDISEYNGTFEEVTSGAIRNDGFYMEYGTSSILDKDVTTVPILFERKIAKVALQTSISTSNFNNPDYYPGALRVDNVEVRNISFDNTFNHTQQPNISNNYYQNLFYLNYSQEKQTTFTIFATYDLDGDFNTTDDQCIISYPFVIGDDGSGYGVTIAMNKYYRVSITINGLNREEVELTISVADWEDTEDQNVDIG